LKKRGALRGLTSKGEARFFERPQRLGNLYKSKENDREENKARGNYTVMRMRNCNQQA
jgi:hypothetical protein